MSRETGLAFGDEIFDNQVTNYTWLNLRWDWEIESNFLAVVLKLSIRSMIGCLKPCNQSSNKCESPVIRVKLAGHRRGCWTL